MDEDDRLTKHQLPPARSSPLADSPHLSREASAAVAAASAALEALDAPPEAPAPASRIRSGSRKLIDLFPPAPDTATVPAPAPPPASAAPPAAARIPASYERFYGLSDHPFDASPEPGFHFHWESHDQALRDLTAALDRHDGTILLTGDTGAGRTTLCRSLISQLGLRTMVSFVADPVASARELLETVLVDFGVASRSGSAAGPLRAASLDDLASALRGFLASLATLRAAALIVIDDADALEAGVLGELHLLSDMAREHKHVQMILVGEPRLVATFQDPALRHWDGPRIALGPLSEAETADYVAHRLTVAGRSDSLFDPDALARIHALSKGLPRGINWLCDRALTAGQRASARVIDRDLVDRAARDLGLLPEVASPPAWRRVLMIIGLLVLALAGAAGAGWIFREPLLRAISRWHLGF